MISFLIFILFVCFVNVSCNEEFSPFVAASCKGGFMNIKVKFASPYFGAVHVRDFRKPECMKIGIGEENLNLNVNIFSKEGDSDYCGVFISKNLERSIQLAVRVHKNLELAEDKFFIITCGKTGNFKDENAKLVFYEKSSAIPLKETLYGHQYEIRAELKNATHPIVVKNCVAFDKNNSKIPLINEFGCPFNPDILTPFIPDADNKLSKSTLKSMFKFPEKSEVHLQCDIGQCEVNCFDVSMCNYLNVAAFSSDSINNNPNSTLNDIKKQLTTTTVFVLDPAEGKGCSNSGVKPSWILWLTVAFGILFVIMLLMNIFLCTAMNCSWARTDIIEKEPSIIEEYDPYRSWHGSQYGSRYSLHGRDSQAKGYISGGSTIHSTRSDRY